MHPDRVGLGVVDDPPDGASPGLLRRDDAVEFLEVQVLQIEAAPILGRRVRCRGADPSLYAALRRHRGGPDPGGDLIVLRPGHPRRRGPLDRREDRERQRVHVDVLDQLVGSLGLEEPVHVQRAGGVGTGLARESGLNGDVRAQAVWRTGREYPAHAFDGLGQAVAVTEDGDEALQVLGVARVVAGDESLHPGPGSARQVGLDTGDGDHSLVQ